MSSDLDLIPFLLSSSTEQWFKVTISDREVVLKYIPLSLIERINIKNMYAFIEDDTQRNKTIITSLCRKMLLKAYEDESFVNSLTTSNLFAIYDAIINDMVTKKKLVEEYYKKYQTKAIKEEKHEDNKLNSLVNMCNVMKECNLSLEQVGSLDEISLFCLMMYISESSVRQSNLYEKAKSKK